MDTESGFSDVVFITAVFGLGETIVQGSVNPDEYYVYKPNLTANRHAILRKKLGEKAIKMVYADTNDFEKGLVKTVNTSEDERRQFVLTNDELTELAKYIVLIEKHYKMPMDVEWAKDGEDGKLYIVQARPETVQSRANKQIIKQLLFEKTQ